MSAIVPEVLTRLAPQLTGEVLEAALAAAQNTKDERHRAEC